MKVRRSSGVLLHITSLPGEYGIGGFGKEAVAFAKKLKEQEMVPKEPKWKLVNYQHVHKIVLLL